MSRCKLLYYPLFCCNRHALVDNSGTLHCSLKKSSFIIEKFSLSDDYCYNIDTNYDCCDFCLIPKELNRLSDCRFTISDFHKKIEKLGGFLK